MADEVMNAAGNRMNVGKAQWSLMLRRMWPALREVVRVTEFGAKKYAPDGWWNRDLDDQETCTSAQNHLFAVMSGTYIDAAGQVHHGQNDPESGLPHWAHAAWNMLAIGALRFKREHLPAEPKP